MGRKAIFGKHSEATQGRGWYSRGYLPHCDTAGLIQHVTFHLADSLPAKALARIGEEVRNIPPVQRALIRRRRLEALLDKGLGSCLLRRPDCARIVEASLLFGDGERYRLMAWTIMPNHVHVLMEQKSGWPLGKVVQSWKRHTARRIRCLEMEQGMTCSESLWQRDYWDRYMRDDRHLAATLRYIEQNPVAAGLVKEASQWPWGSARRRA